MSQVTATKLTPVMLNHAAWVTHDVEATAEFYTRIMGMDLASTVFDDSIPSTGDTYPYFHIFFKMQDGSTLAFFEAPDLPARPSLTHPAYDIFDHIALQADSVAEVDEWAKWLQKNDIEVVGPTNHGGLIYSIYFRDPNNIRLEITVPLDPKWNQHGEKGWADLKMWCETKKKAEEDGVDVGEALVRFIRNRKAS